MCQLFSDRLGSRFFFQVLIVFVICFVLFGIALQICLVGVFCQFYSLETALAIVTSRGPEHTRFFSHHYIHNLFMQVLSLS